MSKGAWYGALAVAILALVFLASGMLRQVWGPEKAMNEQVVKQMTASLTLYQGRTQTLGKRRVVPLSDLAEGHYLSMSTDNDPVGYIIDGREYYFKDRKHGSYACALFFRALTWDLELPVQPMETEGLQRFSGYLAQGSRNSGLGGCRFVAHAQGQASQHELYYSSNDGTVYSHERSP